MISNLEELIQFNVENIDLGTIVSVDFRRGFFYEILKDLPYICPYLQRVNQESIDSGVRVFFKKIRQQGQSFQKPKSHRGVLFYANEKYRGQLLAAIGSYRLKNPDHQIYFLDDIKEEQLGKKLDRLWVTRLDPEEAERSLGLDPNHIDRKKPLHKAVSRKILGRYLFFSDHFRDCDQLLVSDVDVLFLGSTDPAFDQTRGFDLGASIDWMPTLPHCVSPYKIGLENRHKASVGGFFKKNNLIAMQDQLIDYYRLSANQIELDLRPYFNSGILFLEKSPRLKNILWESIKFIYENTEEYYKFWPWPEQTLLNIGFYSLNIKWLNPTVWNFNGPDNVIRHLVGSRGDELSGYSEFQEEVEASWNLFGETHWKDHSLYKKPEGTKKSTTIGWLGEFGWEVTHLTAMANYYGSLGRTIVYTFDDTLSLYSDIPGVEARSHGLSIRRSSGYPGEFPKNLYGDNNLIFMDNEHLEIGRWPVFRYPQEIRSDIKPEKEKIICVHARYIPRNEKGRNWSHDYNEIFNSIGDSYKIAFIGSPNESLHFGWDCRGMDLEELIVLIKKSCLVLGPISGPLHLAQMCGTPIYTWGCKDDRCFSNSAKGRIWNPLKTPHFHPWIGEEGSEGFCNYFDMNYQPSLLELRSGLERTLRLVSS